MFYGVESEVKQSGTSRYMNKLCVIIFTLLRDKNNILYLNHQIFVEKFSYYVEN